MTIESMRLALLKSNIPAYMHGGLLRYIEHGIEPGHFLCAVLQNDLRRSIERADDYNVQHLADYVKFLYCHAPAGCWGSLEKFTSWKGL